MKKAVLIAAQCKHIVSLLSLSALSTDSKRPFVCRAVRIEFFHPPSRLHQHILELDGSTLAANILKQIEYSSLLLVYLLCVCVCVCVFTSSSRNSSNKIQIQNSIKRLFILFLVFILFFNINP